jgi:RNA polymerase sigma-70 factor (ECF subfamily)
MEDLSARIDKLYRDHQRELYKYIYSFTKNPESTEDILQECFSNLISYSHKYSLLDNNLKSFLFKTARNICLNHLKRDNRFTFLPIEFAEKIPGYNGHDKSEEDSTFDDLFDPLLGELKESYVEIFKMKNRSKMKSGEIALKLGISERTVRRRLKYIYSHLRDKNQLQGAEKIEDPQT